MQQALEHPWFDKPRVSLAGEAVDSNDEGETEEEVESAEEEEEVARSAVPVIPEESEFPEEVASSSRASSRRGSQPSTESSRRSSQGLIVTKVVQLLGCQENIYYVSNNSARPSSISAVFMNN